MSEKKNGTNGNSKAVIYTSLDEARKAGRPEGHDKWSLFKLTDPAGDAVYVWAYSVSLAMLAVARKQGWKIGTADASAARVESALDNMSAEDRAALLAKYMPAAKSKK
jgi:hypothetical protein